MPLLDAPVLDVPALALPAPVRLVVSDMDGSLLDERKTLPAATAAVLAALRARGIAFCPASGRQYANLRRLFGALPGDPGADLVYIAENGGVVVHRDEVLASTPLPPDVLGPAVEAVRALRAAGREVGAVVCGARSAWVEGDDAGFLRHVEAHYSVVTQVRDLTAVDDTVLKVAVFDGEDVETATAPAFAPLADRVRVLVSGRHWVDLMHPEADKGVALRHAQRVLGVAPEETLAFGDYLNDLGLLRAAGTGVAMDNAHPDVRAAAAAVAPGHTRNGVLRTLVAALDLDVPGL
ncbi:HAD-IIB family hydrolase [Cellulomonas endophytica]|uniref:HAD-IIB family hydrolase n=1 Tax=Cellulomonas endophytica TaxID=2494735 RepID=UPI001F0C7B0A|nr:HAD family hydrolase [Cellulomonas endophytica]